VIILVIVKVLYKTFYGLNGAEEAARINEYTK